MISVYLDNCGCDRPCDDQEQPNTQKFDYTEWRRDKFNDKSLDELLDEAAEYGRLYHKD